VCDDLREKQAEQQQRLQLLLAFCVYDDDKKVWVRRGTSNQYHEHHHHHSRLQSVGGHITERHTFRDNDFTKKKISQWTEVCASSASSATIQASTDTA